MMRDFERDYDDSSTGIIHWIGPTVRNLPPFAGESVCTVPIALNSALWAGRNPMLYSTDRILTTHAGSLPRPLDLRDMVLAKANGAPYDPAALDERLKSAVAEVVLRQAECGIDCVNDGELSKTNFTDYVRWRIAGYETRPSPGPRRLSITARDE